MDDSWQAYLASPIRLAERGIRKPTAIVRNLLWQRRKQRIRRAYSRLFGIPLRFHDAETRKYIDEIDRYWQLHYGSRVHPLWHIALQRATGVSDVRFIPGFEFMYEILPCLNDMNLRYAFLDKNLSQVFLDNPVVPETIVKRMHGTYYAPDHTPVSADDARRLILASDSRLIVKPSQTDNGVGITGLDVAAGKLFVGEHECSFEQLQNAFGPNFLAQEAIVQHPLLAEVHPSSVNTVRIVTLRWRDQLDTIATVVRFGRDGSLVDNGAGGGVFCGVDAAGRLSDHALDLTGMRYGTHPTTGYDFSKSIRIPDFERFRSLAIDQHRRLYHFDIVSWDLAVAEDGSPVLLEVNFRGSVMAYQLAKRAPLFGDLTAEILESVRARRS